MIITKFSSQVSSYTHEKFISVGGGQWGGQTSDWGRGPSCSTPLEPSLPPNENPGYVHVFCTANPQQIEQMEFTWGGEEVRIVVRTR